MRWDKVRMIIYFGIANRVSGGPSRISKKRQFFTKKYFVRYDGLEELRWDKVRMILYFSISTRVSGGPSRISKKRQCFT